MFLARVSARGLTAEQVLILANERFERFTSFLGRSPRIFILPFHRTRPMPIRLKYELLPSQRPRAMSVVLRTFR
jgi:hypothetical protein